LRCSHFFLFFPDPVSCLFNGHPRLSPPGGTGFFFFSQVECCQMGCFLPSPWVFRLNIQTAFYSLRFLRVLRSWRSLFPSRRGDQVARPFLLYIYLHLNPLFSPRMKPRPRELYTRLLFPFIRSTRKAADHRVCSSQVLPLLITD